MMVSLVILAHCSSFVWLILKTDKSGCATQVVDVTQFNLNISGFQDSFHVQAEMEEYGTGKLEREEAKEQ